MTTTEIPGTQPPARPGTTAGRRPSPGSSVGAHRPRPGPRPVTYSGPPRPLVSVASVVGLVLVLAGQAFVLADVDIPVVRPVVAAVLLIGLPVVVLTRRVFGHVTDQLAAFLYAVGLTVLALIVVPLALNTVLPSLGVGAPLARPVLVAASTVADIGLLALRSPVPLVPRRVVRAGLRAVPRARFEPGVTLGVLAVVLAVAGAVRLNNGLGGGVATLAHATAVAALAVTMLRSRESRLRTVVTIYLAGLALLLGTSLRGWFITGHDIQNEYLAFLYTHDSHHWVMSAYPSPYNACLSVNILPSVLVEYLGVTGVFVFKVVMQLVFALVPLCVYVTARRMASPRVAVVSAALFVFFPTFYTDMPFLVRQEIAYLFVALTLLAVTQAPWSLRRRQGTAFGFGVGVILSHYSTTYVMVITLVLGLFGAGAGSIARAVRERRFRAWLEKAKHARPKPRRHAPPAVLLRPLIVIALALTAYGWSTPATHSGGHLAETVNKLTEAFINGNTEAGSSDLQYSLFGGGGPTPEQRFADYVKSATDVRGPAANYAFPDPTGAVANPKVVERPYLPLTSAGRVVDDAGVNVRGINALMRTASAALFQIFLVVGLLALMLFARVTKRVSREQFWLVLGSIGALGAVVVVPGLSASYGVLRAFQQTLLFAAPVLAIGLVTVLSRLRRGGIPIAAAIVAGMGLVLTGALPALLGGYYAQVTQSNTGQYYDLLYVKTPQLSATRWLARDTTGQGLQTVSASGIVQVTRLQMFLPRSVTVSGDYLPLQLPKDGYVFLSPQTADGKEATVFYTGDLLTYRYPVGALDRGKNLVYSTSGTRIYR